MTTVLRFTDVDTQIDLRLSEQSGPLTSNVERPELETRFVRLQNRIDSMGLFVNTGPTAASVEVLEAALQVTITDGPNPGVYAWNLTGTLADLVDSVNAADVGIVAELLTDDDVLSERLVATADANCLGSGNVQTLQRNTPSGTGHTTRESGVRKSWTRLLCLTACQGFAPFHEKTPAMGVDTAGRDTWNVASRCWWTRGIAIDEQYAYVAGCAGPTNAWRLVIDWNYTSSPPNKGILQKFDMDTGELVADQSSWAAAMPDNPWAFRQWRFPSAVAVDRAGFIYVADFEWEAVPDPYTMCWRGFVAKLNPDGELVWSVNSNDLITTFNFKEMLGLAVGDDGRVYFRFFKRTNATPPYDDHVEIQCVAADGATVWRVRPDYSPALHADNWGEDFRDVVAVDKDGYVYWGSSNPPEDGWICWVSKYTPTGALVWTCTLSGTLYGITVDAEGNVYAATNMCDPEIYGESLPDYPEAAVFKITPDGAHGVWSWHPGTLKDIAVDQYGFVWVSHQQGLIRLPAEMDPEVGGWVPPGYGWHEDARPRQLAVEQLPLH